MKNFRHINAASLQEAASLLKESGGKARLIAGGTDLLGEMKDEILPEYPETIVNLKTIPGLDYVKQRHGELHIGALTRLADIAKNKVVKDRYPLLADAARRTASPHIREMGTIAGNICQSNRCWYYWTPDNRFNCLRKGGRDCYAIVGDGRYHSIYGAVRVNGTPCTHECPAGVAIPDYLSEIREDNLEKAASILLQNNPLPAITGRVCPHFCEVECHRGSYDEAVSIRCIERAVGDFILQKSRAFYAAPKREIKKQVAIIGSGPAGLSAACYLRRLGYGVTVFESMPQAGGMLRYGIPPYRLPKEVVKKQVAALEGMGIMIKPGVKFGQDLKLTELIKKFAAVLLAGGAWQERPVGIKGEELMLSGLELLRTVNPATKKFQGKKVAVIGGGNVALDVARTLLRLGGEPEIIYRRTKNEMPALKEELDKAEEEGIKIRFLTSPVAVSEANGVLRLKCEKMKLGPLDETGRPRPVPVSGSAFTAEFGAVVKATGEEPDISIVPGKFLDKKKRLKIASPQSLLGDNVFAAGDFVSGAATVVRAIASGRIAAGEINRYLGGPGTPDEKQDCSPQKFDGACLKKSSRLIPAEIPLAQRIKSLNTEDTGSLDMEAVKTESRRCFNCGCLAVNASDTAPALIALDARIKTTRRTIRAGEFFSVDGDKTTVLKDGEIVTEIVIPEPGVATRCSFSKFAIRKSIDFSVVNCAAAITFNGRRVKAARICLNAVYNLPYRAAGAEAYLVGKPINESVAEAAAAIAVSDTLPLINNRYKIQVARTLVKRAILACRG